MTKIAFIGVVLIGIAISLGFRDKGSLQRLVEWCHFGGGLYYSDFRLIGVIKGTISCE